MSEFDATSRWLIQLRETNERLRESNRRLIAAIRRINSDWQVTRDIRAAVEDAASLAAEEDACESK